jgi:hypothetical protein
MQRHNIYHLVVIPGGLGVVNRSLSLVVAWSRVILSEVNWGSVRDCVMCGLFGIVVGGFVVVSRCSVCSGVVLRCLGTWSTWRPRCNKLGQRMLGTPVL